MSLFSCCPKKPKMTLDYVIKWVEDTDKTIEELNSTIETLETWKETIDNNISELVRQAIENYDWSELPVDALQAKADKVEYAITGNLASLDSEGNLQDSGKKPADFAPAAHVHDVIESGQVQVLCDNEGIHLNISDNGITITYSNLVNLFRALQTPDNAPTENSDKFVTSGGVKTALDGKAPANYVPWKIEKTTSEGTSRVLVDGEEIEFFIEDVTGDDPREVTAALNFSKMPNFARALRDPSSTPEDDNNKLITSKAVYDALAGKAGIYNGTLRVDSDGNNSYPIPEDGIVQTALDSFVESAEKDKMYNVLVQFATQYSFNNYYPAIVYWEIGSLDETVVHIYVGDYHFMATKAEGATMWGDEEFSRYKISTFLETF